MEPTRALYPEHDRPFEEPEASAEVIHDVPRPNYVEVLTGARLREIAAIIISHLRFTQFEPYASDPITFEIELSDRDPKAASLFYMVLSRVAGAVQADSLEYSISMRYEQLRGQVVCFTLEFYEIKPVAEVMAVVDKIKQLFLEGIAYASLAVEVMR